MLNGLADTYIVRKRLDEAGRLLDRVLTIFATASDTGPADQIRVLNSQAVFYASQGQWRKAEDDLKSAISLADVNSGLNPVELEPLLNNYARVLRGNSRMREARTVEARVAAIHSRSFADSIVDVTQLKATVK